MLSHALESYLALRRAAGFELRVPACLLHSFVRFAQARDEQHVTAETARDWAALAPSPAQRHYRLNTVIRFARHLQAEDLRHQVPPPHTFGHHRQRPVPFIFAPTQIAQLIQAASRLGPPDSLRPYTVSFRQGCVAAADSPDRVGRLSGQGACEEPGRVESATLGGWAC